MPFWRSEEDQKTVRGAVFPTNTAHATLADANAQLVQLLGHAWPAIAAKAQPVLLADMRKDHHVAPLTMRWWPVPPGAQPSIRHAHQLAQATARQVSTIIDNELKSHGF